MGTQVLNKKDALKEKNKYFGSNGVITFAGIHLIVELWGSTGIDNIENVRTTMTQAVKDCGAHLLNIDLHEFTPYGGISGVAVLQESHISIHSWPEYDYTAMDIFVCGSVDPYKTLPIIKKNFKPKSMQISEIKRGII